MKMKSKFDGTNIIIELNHEEQDILRAADPNHVQDLCLMLDGICFGGVCKLKGLSLSETMKLAENIYGREKGQKRQNTEKNC